MVGVQESSEGGFNIHLTFPKDVLGMTGEVVLTAEAELIAELSSGDRVKSGELPFFLCRTLRSGKQFQIAFNTPVLKSHFLLQ